MKTKLILLAVVAGGSMFAQPRFSVRIGGGGAGYYAPSDRYRSQENYRPSNGYGYSAPAYGYYGYDPETAHERAEQHALSHHQMEERFQYGSSEELRQHHIQEQRDLAHEQWHERHGDRDAYGPGHESAEDGYRYIHRH